MLSEYLVVVFWLCFAFLGFWWAEETWARFKDIQKGKSDADSLPKDL